LQNHFGEGDIPLNQIRRLIEENHQIKSQAHLLNDEIFSLRNENSEMKKQLLSLQKQIQQLTKDKELKEKQNYEMQLTISNLKSNLDFYPIAPFIQCDKSNQNKPILLKSLLWSYIQDPVQHFKQEMNSLSQKIKHQFNKSFIFEFTIEQAKVQQNFPFQFDNHEGLFSHLTKSYSLIQLRNILLIETSSDGNPLDFPKENILSWGAPHWYSKDLSNSSITFTLLSGEFSIEGFRICSELEDQPINFKHEGKEKDGKWTDIYQRQDELMKRTYDNFFYSETSFECKKKEFFESFCLTNISPNTDEKQNLNLYSIEFFGQFIQKFPKIIQKTYIKSEDPLDRFGVLFYLQRKLSFSEFHSGVLVSASSSGDPINYPPEDVLFYGNDNWFSKDYPNQSITISFQSIELEIQSYQFSIWYKWRPHGWLVEGRLRSNNKWIQVDKRGNEFVKDHASSTDNVKITFQCQNPGRYSEFRFKMTQKNQKGNNVFNLNSIELLGI
jgi:hypothetical protein